MNVIFLIIVMVLLIAFSFISQNIKAKQSAKMQSMIEPGVKVKTFSGLQGTVVKVEKDILILEIAPKVETTWSRNSIAVIVPTNKPGVEGQTNLSEKKSTVTTDSDSKKGGYEVTSKNSEGTVSKETSSKKEGK